MTEAAESSAPIGVYPHLPSPPTRRNSQSYFSSSSRLFLSLFLEHNNSTRNSAMKVFSLAVVLAPPNGTCTILTSASDLSSFSFYQRGSVAEFMSFFTKTISERTPQGQRQSVQENSYTAHVYNRGGAEQLAGASHHRRITLRAPLNHFRRHHHGPGVPRAACVLAPHEAARRFHREGAAGVVQDPRGDLVPGDQHVPAEVPGPAAGGCDHEGPAGTR